MRVTRAPDKWRISTWEWFKSTFSQANDNCVEVAFGPGVVAVRDTKKPGVALIFGGPGWQAFIDKQKRIN